MERIKRALAEARRQREKLLGSSHRQTTAYSGDEEAQAAGHGRIPLPRKRDPKLWTGVAVAAILVVLLAWLTTSNEPEKTVRLSALDNGATVPRDSVADMRDSVATTEDLSRRLASLKAQVDVLDASITRLYDKLMDVHVRIDTLPGSGISAAAIEAKKAGVPDQEARPGAQGTAEAAAVLGTAVIADAPGHPPADEQAAAPAAGTAAAVAEDKTEDKQLVSARAANAGTRPDANIEKPAPAAQKPTDTANRQKAPADAGASTTTQGGPWVINLVSLADKPAADRFAARAEAKDIHVQQSQVTVKGKSYWRVQAGGFATADEAKAHADSIKTKLGLKDTWISRR